MLDPPAEVEPPTEPFDKSVLRRKTFEDVVAEPPVTTVPLPQLPRPAAERVFEPVRYHFTTGVAAGETARIRDDKGDVLLAYRSFASVVGVVAALVSGIVTVAGLASVGFLLAEQRVAAAILALMLSAGFAIVIAMLVPPVNVTLFEGTNAAITIAQQSNLSFPVVTFAVIGKEGRALARLRRNVFASLGRDTWRILSGDSDRLLGYAVEESLSRALLRKAAGKFSTSFESNVQIHYLDVDAGRIVRRAEGEAPRNVLDVSEDKARVLDRRIALALATLILGAEP